jgi:protein SCO1/2
MAMIGRGLRTLGIVALAAGLGACDRGLEGMVIDPPKAMPTFTFTRVDGSSFSTAPTAGQYTVLFFGYTNCPDVCPTTMADFTRVKSTLGEAASRVRFVFISVDPDRDTPQVAADYARKFDPAFIGVSADPLTTVSILQAYGIAATPDVSSDHAAHLVSHSSQVHLLDDQGRLIALYPYGSPWKMLAHDLAQLL